MSTHTAATDVCTRIAKKAATRPPGMHAHNNMGAHAHFSRRLTKP